mmetsp:Transcript_77967/g.200736  ORF Transcript_77967/g.200736 Transcript_77967/m.200736 type:complete len:203 (+) Transcript_77967:1847-2455(+)
MRWPPPHDLLQAVQSLHMEATQSNGASGPIMQEPVTFRCPLQPLPVKAGSCKIVRVLYFWSVGEAQMLHPLHSESLQSLLSQSAWHGFVPFSEPSHGLPHSLLSVRTVRARLQMPSQVGSLHSDHSPSWQSSGTHVSEQVGLPSHSRRSTSSPSQSFCVEAMAMGSSGIWSVSAIERLRFSVPVPHVVEHSPFHSDQSPQAQ